MMKVPAWADPKLSAELPDLRLGGEGQCLEFKVTFPEQARDLAAEVAAFATSGGGEILLGVADDGSLVGLEPGDAAGADKHRLRAQQIVKTVAPPVKADILIGYEDGRTVLCIRLGAQSEPLYYSESRPYIRSGSMSRPAEPMQVKERVWAHPSSEFKRKAEEIKLRAMEACAAEERRAREDSANQLRAMNEEAAASRRAYDAQSEETMKAITAELLRR
jgi:ATP-dependent DNA helicase RecG